MNIFEFLEQYWLFISLVTMVVGSWLRTEIKIAKLMDKDQSQQESLIKHEKLIEAMQPIWFDIRERLVSIETILTFRDNSRDNRNK